MIDRAAGIGYLVHGDTIGETWLELVELVLKNGVFELDENRGRFAVPNVRFSSATTDPSDDLINAWARGANVELMKDLVFKEDTMVDLDITPSFRAGAKSYKRRIEDGDLVSFAIRRLARFPESKKAILVFPTYEDYQAIDATPWNDYLPCIVALQFRLANRTESTANLNVTMFMRSWDAFQKAAGDLTVVCMLADQVRVGIAELREMTIQRGRLDGLVTDIHIYENTYQAAQIMHMSYLGAQPQVG